MKFNRKSILTDSILTLVFFIFLFSPPIIRDLNVLIILSFICAVLLINRGKNSASDIKAIVRNSGLKRFSIIFVAAIAWLLFAMFLSIDGRIDRVHYALLLYRFFLIMPIAAIIMVWMLRLTQKRDPLKFILKYTIYAFALQAIIALLALFIPAVKDFLVSVMATNTGASVFNNTYEVSRRFYGFSNSMLDSFGYATGLATILAAVYALLYKKYIYLLIVPALGVVGLLNSRTAIIITAIGIIVAVPLIATIAYNRARLKELKLKVNSKHIAVAAVVIVALTATILTIDTVSPATLTSTKTALDRTARTLTGDATDNPLFKPSFWELPEKPEVIIIGSGHTVFEASGYNHSDVGYINDIWSFGIIGSILLYSSILALFVPAIRNSTKTERFIIIFLIVALFIFQIKARAFMANPGLLMTLLIGMAINLRIHSRLKHGAKNE